MIAPLGFLAAVYFLLNSGLTAVAVSLSKGVSAFQLWREHFALMSLNYFAAASAAFVFIVLVHYVGGPALGCRPLDPGLSPGHALLARKSR